MYLVFVPQCLQPTYILHSMVWNNFRVVPIRRAGVQTLVCFLSRNRLD